MVVLCVVVVVVVVGVVVGVLVVVVVVASSLGHCTGVPCRVEHFIRRYKLLLICSLMSAEAAFYNNFGIISDRKKMISIWSVILPLTYLLMKATRATPRHKRT